LLSTLDYLEPPVHLARLRRCAVETSGKKLAEGPNVIRDPLRYRRGNTKGLMDTAEIEMSNE